MLPERSTNMMLENEILPYLPRTLSLLISSIPRTQLAALTEIRLRKGKPLIFHLGLREQFVDADGRLTKNPERAYIVSSEEIVDALNIMSQSSLYALEEELRNGYLTLRGGHRVGFVGQALVEGGKIRSIKHISAFNIRIAREIPGAADAVMPYLINMHRSYNTLIISPPQCGKTTILRDIARQLSNGIPGMFSGIKVGIVDERSEIAGAYEGVPQKNVGIRTDVLDACPKAEGMIMLIRSMSPQVIVVDEIGKNEDVYAIEEAVRAGVNLIVSVHGTGISQIKERPSLHKLFREQLFERYIVLGRSRGVGTIEEIYDEQFTELLHKPPVDRKEIKPCG